MSNLSNLKVPIIVGPTAVGKTALSICLAEKMKAEIISADSRQFYKHLDIGTAKASLQIRKKIKHHFIDILEPDAYYSAGMFARDARQKIMDLLAQGILPIVVGGSGLYIRALTEGIFEIDAKDPALRRELAERVQIEGLQGLYDELCRVDPAYAAKLSVNDRHRILRALEVFLITGKTFSSWHQEKTEPAPFDSFTIGLNSERPLLYRRINERVDQMLLDGLIEEVTELQANGYDRHLNALNTVGYKEVFDYLQGQTNRDEMSELIKRNSRRYAKRQLTWFNSDKDIQWFDVVDESSISLICGAVSTRLH